MGVSEGWGWRDGKESNVGNQSFSILGEPETSGPRRQEGYLPAVMTTLRFGTDLTSEEGVAQSTLSEAPWRKKRKLTATLFKFS